MSQVIGIDLGGGKIALGLARESLKGYSFKAVSARVKVLASELGEDGAILGAAWLARRKLDGGA
ncbi:MAG: hypothetical protein OXI77_10960 [Chloroflexota bacterium]|nr:hypothetical protein [Chloroflexota bacterium]MDE2908976.1 hypothetical protein [Chloroflexota bacterium]